MLASAPANAIATGAAPPLANANLLLQPFEEHRGEMSQRYLLDTGTRQAAISGNVFELISLLQTPSSSWDDLAARYRARTGDAADSSELKRLVHDVLPPEIFDATLPTHTLKRGPFLWRREIVPAQLAGRFAQALAPLFNLWLAGAVLALFVIAQLAAMPHALSVVHQPWGGWQTIAVVAGLLLSIFIHELGHVAACARARCPHGGIGVGLYLVFPAFYADVSHAWRLSRRRRMLVDVGGLYFQAMTVVAIAAYAIWAQSDTASKLLWFVTYTMLHTLNPFFKFDGYWLLSDASGLSNLHQQVRSVMVECLRRLRGGPPSDAEPQPAQSQGLRRSGVLYGYALLGMMYLGFILHFLWGQLALLTHSYPAMLARSRQVIGDELVASNHAGVVAVAGKMLVASLWPLCVLLMAAVVARMLWRGSSRLWRESSALGLVPESGSQR